MSDNTSVTPANDSAVIYETSLCVYQALLEIQHQQPELLRERYRNIPWHDARNQAMFMMKLKEGLSRAQDKEALILRAQKFLEFLLVPSYLESNKFTNLIEKVSLLIRNIAEAKHSEQVRIFPSETSSVLPKPGALSELSKGIAILLLDAENLQLDPNTEKFLSGVCTYPIQIKIAFANWSKMGKQDAEFHKRGYELIHVPAGKDSADVKMATVGSSIFVHYPTAKEVLVCSSDAVLTHLCTTLQTHGLTVYLVRKKDELITVLNSKTSQITTHSLKPILEVPPLALFINQLKDLIKSEQEKTKNQWIKLARISQLFQEKYNLTISQVVATHFPGKRARDIFIENSADFAVHQVSPRDGIYLNLFDIKSAELRPINNSHQPTSSKAQVISVNQITSRADLENVLVKIMQDLTPQSPGSYISITTLGSQFQRQYGQSVTQLIKNLHLSDNLIKFLKSCSAFELKQTDKGWGVAIRETISKDPIV